MERRRHFASLLLLLSLPLALLLATGSVLLFVRGQPDGDVWEGEKWQPLVPTELTNDDGEETNGLFVTRGNEDLQEGRLLVVLHGCGRSAADWFVLPEEEAIVRTALAGPFAAVVAIDSHDLLWHCWRTDADAAVVRRAVAALMRTLCGTTTPCFRGGAVVLGTSSGGTMATALLSSSDVVPNLVGVVALVSPGDAPSLRAFAAASANSSQAQLPRVAFVHMAGDTVFATAEVINAHVAALKGTARAFLCTGEIHVDRAFFARRVLGMSYAASATLWKGLVEAGLVDAVHARATVPTTWDAAAEVPRLLERCAQRMPAFAWEQHADAVVEELRVLQNVHETTREHAADALAWVLRLE